VIVCPISRALTESLPRNKRGRASLFFPKQGIRGRLETCSRETTKR
jgi:hypothetical protein